MIKRILNILILINLFYIPICCAEQTIAVIAPRSGENAILGDQLLEGAKQAIQEINSQGGLLGQKIDMLTIDDRCDDRFAISTAQMLTILKSKQISLVVGPYCSNKFDDVANIYQEHNIFQIVPTNQNNQSKINKDKTLLLGTLSQMSKDFFNFYNRNYAGLKVGFIYDNDIDLGYNQIASSLFDEFQRYGKSQLLKFYTYDEKETSLSKLSKQIVKDNINIVFSIGESKTVSKFIKSIYEKNNDTIFFSPKNMITDNLFESINTKKTKIYTMQLDGLQNSLNFTEDLVNLRLLGVEPEGLAKYSYIAIKSWSNLIKQNNTFDYNKLTKSLHKQEIKENWDNFLMHSGKNNSSKYIIELVDENNFIQVY